MKKVNVFLSKPLRPCSWFPQSSLSRCSRICASWEPLFGWICNSFVGGVSKCKCHFENLTDWNFPIRTSHFKTHFESRNGLFYAFRGHSTYRLKVVKLWICILTHPPTNMSICNAKIELRILIRNAVELQMRQNGVILIFLLENIIVVTKVTVTITVL